MSKFIEELLSISSQALLMGNPYIAPEYKTLLGSLYDEIIQILSLKNGFYAFESALHFFPAIEEPDGKRIDVNQWNHDDLWQGEYDSLVDDLFFFAEDVFGCQFCIKDGKLYTFDPETGNLGEISNNFNGWAKAVLDDYNFMTGYPLAHEWQVKYGELPCQKRLLPKKLFVFGGGFAVDNLYLADAVEGMKYRASVAKQIYNLPNGTTVKMKIE